MKGHDLYESLKSWEDIEQLITAEIRESQILEYKRAETPFSEPFKKGIASSVSAMANSSGGVIIYGVETQKIDRDKTKPIKIWGVAPVNIETFDRVVNSQIKNAVQFETKVISKKDSDLKVLIVHIPQSDEAPHQSLSETKYFRRSGIENIGMEHDLVELYFGRRRRPQLRLYAKYCGEKLFKDIQTLPSGYSEQIPFRLYLANSGKRTARFVDVVFSLPRSSDLVIETKSQDFKSISYLHPKETRQIIQYSNVAEAFHPDFDKCIGSINVSIRNSATHLPDFSFIEWDVFADEMTQQKGKLQIKDTL